MYLVSVILLMVVLPVTSIALDHFVFQQSVPVGLLVGKWFVFWVAGVRLFLAGLRQFFQPRFTLEKIFGLSSNDALPFVRELGVANFATGTAGMLSLVRPNFVAPVAMVAAIFYGIAGSRHVTDKGKNLNQTTVMITDILVSLVFIVYIAYAGLGR
jgi:hypothetical protein